MCGLCALASVQTVLMRAQSPCAGEHNAAKKRGGSPCRTGNLAYHAMRILLLLDRCIEREVLRSQTPGTSMFLGPLGRNGSHDLATMAELM